MEASPYPSAVVIRGLAPSSVELTGKPFFVSGLSWLSYSRPSHFSTVPGLVSPVSPVARLKAPHAGQVVRSAAADLNPLDGITQLENCLTHFDRWRPCTAKLHRVFPHRPHSGGRPETEDRRNCHWQSTDRSTDGQPFFFSGHQSDASRLFHRIECRDYSEATMRLPDKGSVQVRPQD